MKYGRILLRDFRTVKDGMVVNFNIGTAAHGPATLAVLRKHLGPDARITVWADAPLSPPLARLMRRHFPETDIVSGQLDDSASAELKRAVDEADLFLVSSGSTVAGSVRRSLTDFQRRAGKPAGAYAIGCKPDAIPWIDRMAFAWFRDPASAELAAGADHLAVKYRPENVKYCAVLPFDVGEYRKDFSGPSLAEFEADLRGAYKVITCPAAVRDYVPASDYVRKHSDVLLTLWDGYENLDPKTHKAEPGGIYFLIRAAFRMDDLLLPQPEKKHLVVNLPVERSKKGPEYHRQRQETQCSGYPEDGTLSVVERKGDSADLAFSSFAEFEFPGNRYRGEI